MLLPVALVAELVVALPVVGLGWVGAFVCSGPLWFLLRLVITLAHKKLPSAIRGAFLHV